MIEIRALSKRYGGITAVDGLNVTVRPGSVTGFLGPNGAGKTTTMRIALGLARPTAGEVLLGGRRYGQIARPMFEVGALLDAAAIETGRTAADHLRWLARSHRIGDGRVRELLEEVGLAAVARRQIATFSLGMKQRLGLAAALLGDPGILILDEPVNGLDPDGVRWLRELLRALAAQGRTILVSSHLMSEMAITADRLVVVARGRLVADTTVAELVERSAHGVMVRGTPAPELAERAAAAGGVVTPQADGRLLVQGLEANVIGRIAADRGFVLHELTPCSASLEDAYLALTGSGDGGGRETARAGMLR